MPVRTVLDPVGDGSYAAAWALDFGPMGVPRLTVLDNPAALPARLPEADELFLWFGAPGSEGYDDLLPYLSEAECGRLARLQQPGDRSSFAATHAALRFMLATMLNGLPRDVALVDGRYGKPMLDARRHGGDAARVHFNISHTRGLVAVALAGCPVGVDVEARREIRDMRAVADSVFAKPCLRALADASSEAARRALFYRFWTLGEAFIKATGEGLAQGLKTFAFSARGVPVLAQVSDAWRPPTRWRFGVFPE